ncbi:hypothetical protein SAMN05421823_11371 [Catalinimonas alkaloidigena]|uniref:Uncharacterized protein n=1 Tax=Catalinimonas alkaloidigena TaxID=1075417 RepID=A0A1G9T2Q3_9BACT|nr:hypothetical protein SAMN05421823_11371 [Catalinimonas alkaloidigena]
MILIKIISSSHWTNPRYQLKSKISPLKQEFLNDYCFIICLFLSIKIFS